MRLPPAISRLFKRSYSLTDGSKFLLDAMGGWKTITKKYINEKTALRYSAMYGCVRILAESVATIPLMVYRRRKDGGRDRAPDHRLYDVLHIAPNEQMTSFTWRETSVAHQVLRGNAYSYIKQEGSTTELLPLLPDRTHLDTSGKKYVTWIGGQQYDILPAQMLHVPGLSLDGRQGLTPIQLFAESIGLGLAYEEFSARFFANNASPGGIIEYSGKFTGPKDPKYLRLKKSWDEMHKGIENLHKAAILEEGTKFKELTIHPVDAQLLESRKFQVTDIARIYRIPPHMLAELDRATFNNIEEMSLEFVTYTLMPWLVRWEQALNLKLLSLAERKEYYIEFNVEALLRGNIKARTEHYHTMIQDGVYNADEVRASENINPQPDGQGAIYYMPLNMVPKQLAMDLAEAEIQQARALPAPKAPEIRSERPLLLRRRIANRYLPLVQKAAGSAVGKEIKAVRAKVSELLGERSAEDFRDWLQEYYAEYPQIVENLFAARAASFATEMVGPVEDELGAEIDGRQALDKARAGYLENLGLRHAAASRSQLFEALNKAEEEENDPAEEIELVLSRWEENRAGEIALRETTVMRNLFPKVLYAASGVLYIRSVSDGENCPYCDALHGKVIGIEGYFFKSGDEFRPEEAEVPLTFHSNISHPPYHSGCDCDIVAETGG